MQKDAAAKKLGINTSGGEPQVSAASILTSLGGWIGVVEATAPALSYTICYLVTKAVLPSVIVAGTISIFFLLTQLVRKKPLTQTAVGMISLAIAVFLPLREGGQPADYFVQGFITNAIYLGVLSLSIIIRRPLIGFLVGAFKGDLAGWIRDRKSVRRYSWVTVLWVGLFAFRLAVQLPLYFSGSVEALGIARVLMGVPLYGILLWFSWLLLRKSITAVS
ncbi:MAG: hypothetical protein RIR16_1073 [Actinomycetota bacterium]|jgi:hypothetical protein